MTQTTAVAPEWFVSYAWGEDAAPEGRARGQAVEELCERARQRGVRIQRDKDVLRAGDRISAFAERIGEGDLIFIILSQKYLESQYCMAELHAIWRASKEKGDQFSRRIRAYTLPDAVIDKPRAPEMGEPLEG